MTNLIHECGKMEMAEATVIMRQIAIDTTGHPLWMPSGSEQKAICLEARKRFLPTTFKE